MFVASSQSGSRLGSSLHAPAHRLPDAALQRVPAPPPAVSRLGGESRRPAPQYQRVSTFFFPSQCRSTPPLRFSPLQEHRNLSQLPNFAFSTALCHFALSQQYEADCEESNKHRQKADQMLQSALIMFPGGY